MKKDTEALESEKEETEKFIKNIPPNLLNSRQLYMLYKLADGSLIGKLTVNKWCKMTKSTAITASRDIADLVKKGYLIRIGSGSRNYEYVLKTQ